MDCFKLNSIYIGNGKRPTPEVMAKSAEGNYSFFSNLPRFQSLSPETLLRFSLVLAAQCETVFWN